MKEMWKEMWTVGRQQAIFHILDIFVYHRPNLGGESSSISSHLPNMTEMWTVGRQQAIFDILTFLSTTGLI